MIWNCKSIFKSFLKSANSPILFNLHLFVTFGCWHATQGRSTTKLTRVMAPFGAMVSCYGFILQQIGTCKNDYAQISLTNCKTLLYSVAQNFLACCWGRGKWLMSKLSIWESHWIDLFTDTAAILKLLDLRSITGFPGGTRSAFTRAFRAKRELQCIFLGKKGIIITSKQGTTIYFSHYNFFLAKLKEKSTRKARVITDASISDRAHAPWASYNTP